MSRANSLASTDRRMPSLADRWPRLLGEVGVQDPELADRLGAGDRQVGVVDRVLDVRDQVRVILEVGDGRVGRLAVPLLPRAERLSVDRDQRGDERPAVPDDHALADDQVAAEPVLEDRGSDVLAAGGDDYLLLPAGDRQESLVVQFAEVAAAEPAVLGERLGGRLLVLPVAGEDRLAVDQHLAVVGDADGDSGQGQADAADLLPVRPVHADRRGRLGEPVPLEDGDAAPRKKCPSRSASAAPPDTAYCARPPSAARILP